jgi:hypothetical protein
MKEKISLWSMERVSKCRDFLCKKPSGYGSSIKIKISIWGIKARHLSKHKRKGISHKKTIWGTELPPQARQIGKNMVVM